MAGTIYPNSKTQIQKYGITRTISSKNKYGRNPATSNTSDASKLCHTWALSSLLLLLSEYITISMIPSS